MLRRRNKLFRECDDIVISSLCLFSSENFPRYTGWVLISYTSQDICILETSWEVETSEMISLHQCESDNIYWLTVCLLDVWSALYCIVLVSGKRSSIFLLFPGFMHTNRLISHLHQQWRHITVALQSVDTPHSSASPDGSLWQQAK